MQALKFDTLNYVKQLTSAGVDPEVAEIHAMTMANAFGMYIDDLVTKDYLDARFDALDAKLDKRFAEQDAKFERRFAEQDSKFDKRFGEQDKSFGARFHLIESDLRVVKWGQAIIIAAILLPQVAKLAG